MFIRKTAFFILCSYYSHARAVTMTPELSSYFNTASVTEFGTLTGTATQVSAFLDFVKVNWGEILNDLDNVAAEEKKQRLLVNAAESLPPVEYLEFLSLLLDKYQAGKVKKAAAIAAFSPGAKKYGFLAFNYQHVKVKSLCERAKTIFTDVADMQELMSQTLSGAQGKQIGAALASENRPQPEMMPAQ